MYKTNMYKLILKYLILSKNSMIASLDILVLYDAYLSLCNVELI